jgi:stage II sporulation protein AB (anti-sigma F factor)
LKGVGSVKKQILLDKFDNLPEKIFKAAKQELTRVNGIGFKLSEEILNNKDCELIDKMENYMKLELSAISQNESFARSAVAAFALNLNPSLSELSDIKTAVSEAVTNSIVHAYQKKSGENKIVIECAVTRGEVVSPFPSRGILHIKITDYGCGIQDTEKAVLPFFTTLEKEERSGMGFTIMQTFMEDFSLHSEVGKGTSVEMKKAIGGFEIKEIGKVGIRADA